ncbi:MAG: C39 family peptidase [Nocardioidaceae bacterium]
MRARKPFALLTACAAAALSVTTLTPASSALANQKDSSVRDVAYQQWASAADFSLGSFHGTTVTDDALTIDEPTGTFDDTDPFGDGSATTYDVATWTSPEVSPGIDISELVSSWNATTPPGTWIQMSVSGVADNGERSKDYILGRWASGADTIHRTSVPSQGDDLATVAIDTLKTRSDRSMQTWQLTVSLYRKAGTSATPSVSLVGGSAAAHPYGEKVGRSKRGGGASGTTLDVPTYSQEIHSGEYPEFDGGGEAWCSPTSTSMVLGYWDRGPTPEDYSWVDPSYDDPWVDYAAANTFDYNYDGAGNWPFNAAYASRYGLESFVTRLDNMRQAEQFIKAGIPLVVSVSFEKGELTGAGYGTNGHLMVIVGFTKHGDVVVNDPASHLIPSDDEVRTVYDRTEFQNVWVPHSGGIAYVIHPASVPLPKTHGHDRNW